MQEDKRKQELLQLFSNISGKTRIVEPMKKIHGTLRDRDAVEREIALIMREILEQGFSRPSSSPSSSPASSPRTMPARTTRR